jgi:hypothetical protein
MAARASLAGMTESLPHDSHSPGSRDARRPRPQRPPCRVRVGSAEGLLAVVPHLLGFHPANSLVLLGIGGPHARVRLAFRYDLPNPPEAELAQDIAAHAETVLERQHLTVAIAVGYGDGQIVTPVVDVVVPALRAAGVTVQEVLRVSGGRYWSYTCGDPACCPPDGVAVDLAAHPAAAALAKAGLTARADRSDLARTIAPLTEVAESMSQATERARDRAIGLIEQAIAGHQIRDALQPIADAGRRSVRLAVTRYRRGGALTEHDEIAWLGLTLTDLRVRDDAWARMDPRFNEAHLRLWTDLVRHLPSGLVAAPAALLAFTAWQAGEGALASMALERSLQADPEYSMALLLAQAVGAGLPPSAARLPMTPKQVAASYASRRPAGPGQRPSRRAS